jgi:hypothetical protein
MAEQDTPRTVNLKKKTSEEMENIWVEMRWMIVVPMKAESDIGKTMSTYTRPQVNLKCSKTLEFLGEKR